MSESNRGKKIRRWLLLAVVLIVAFPFGQFGFMLIKPALREYFRRIPFDAATWQDEKRVYSDDAVRKRMLPSLLRAHSLIGSNPEQVKALLGPPMERKEYTYYGITLDYLAPDDMVYWIGPQEGFMTFDSIWLVLFSGKSGAIEQYRVTYAGYKEVRNPPCEQPGLFMNEVVRVDENNKRLFVTAYGLGSRSKASPVLRLMRAYVAKCHPGWGRRWSASFFTNRELAGYKDEQSPKVLQDGSWAKAYLAEYENETDRLTLHPALPKERKVLSPAP
jgi:hypothetical protein